MKNILSQLFNSSQPQCGFTAGERQAWTKYENNGN